MRVEGLAPTGTECAQPTLQADTVYVGTNVGETMNMKNIPNLQWLAYGLALSVFVTAQVPVNVFLISYMAVGAVVASAFLAFSNPRTQPRRFDIALCVPFLAILWPVLGFAMLLQRPWNDPKWKNRNVQQEVTRTVDRK